MKRRIISIYTYSTLSISAFMAPFLAVWELKFLPTCIWVTVVLIASAFMLWLYETDSKKENAPDDREINQGYSKKFYNFNLSEMGGAVNGRK